MKGTLFEKIATETLGSRRIRNLTPRPIRVFCHPFCFIGTKPEAGEEGWSEEELNDSTRLGGYIEIPPDGRMTLRLKEDNLTQDAVEVGRFFDVPETETGMMAACSIRFYDVPAELPSPKLGVLLIVSLPFAMGLAAAGVCRDDIACPDTGPTAKRDDQGHLTAVTAFVRVLTADQFDAHHRGVRNGRRQRADDTDERRRNVATGPPVLSIDSRAESIELRTSFEHGVRSGWETR